MLKKITIKGYKSIKEAEIELGNINILIGANGAGKSNFISFFKLLRWMIQIPGQLQLFIGKSGGANSLLFEGAAVTPQIEAELQFETDVGRNDYFFRLFHGSPDTFIFAEEKYRFSRNTYQGLANWIPLDAGHKEAAIIDKSTSGDATAKTLVRQIQNKCVVYQFHNTSDTARIRQKWKVDENSYLLEDAANLAPFLLRLQEHESAYYKRIVEVLTLIVPFFSNFVLEPEYGSIMLKWREKGSDLLFTANQASDGTLRAMALITVLLQPPEILPEVLILDEPELGLHPYAINTICGLINLISHRCQVILATQSTLLVDGFEPKDILVVERKNRPSCFSRLDAEDLQDWLDEYSLSELWNKNLIGGRPSR
ncbi:MAG: AAA family ATPase [Oscillatoriaceae cyanobacterium]